MTERAKEEPVKDRIKKVLRQRGAYFRMPPANGYGKAGDFDFVCCVNGRFLGIEAKRDANEQPTQLQTDNAEAVLRAGGTVLLIHKDNVDIVGPMVDYLRQHKTAPSYWPAPKPQVDDHDVVVKRKKP